MGREDLQAKVTANGKVQATRRWTSRPPSPARSPTWRSRRATGSRKGQFLLQIDAANPRAAARSTEASMQALLRDLDSAERQPRAGASRLAAGGGEPRGADHLRRRPATRPAPAWRRPRPRCTPPSAGWSRPGPRWRGPATRWPRRRCARPWTAIVTAKRVEEGEVAVVGVLNQPGTVLLTISDMSVVETEMEVDETSIPSVKVGQEARVRIDAYPNRTFDGVVTEVGGSPIIAATQHAERGHQVQGQDPDQEPAARHQARPVGAGRHPHRLPRARRWWCPSRPW